MEHPLNMQAWVEGTLAFWKSQNIQLENGASEIAIAESENIIGIKFPLSFIELYKVVNGFKDYDWDANMFSIWPLQRIIKEYTASKDKTFIGFCDFLINSHCIGFLKNANGVFKDIDPSLAIASTFEEAIELINSNSDLIY
ncbi:MAG TPA: SMI1/KNR4 family protein [Puia sp.]|nr:SMI1/KNR4 family protein [Puia sp.]